MMEAIDIPGGQLEYRVRGQGHETLLLVPGAIVRDAFSPLAERLAQVSAHRWQIVDLHRRGYGRSTRPSSPFGIERQAEDCLALMDALRVPKVHFVGHSMGGLIGIQLARSAPERIDSLTLVEPSLVAFIPGAQQAGRAQAEVGARFQSGDRAGALDMFLRGVGGDRYRDSMDEALPAGWFEQATMESDVFFQVELPSIRTWRFDPNGGVPQRVLSVYGVEPRWGGVATSGADFDNVLRTWFPQTKSLAIQGAFHWPHVTHSAQLAESISRFAAGGTP